MPTFFSHLECSVPCGAGPSDPRQIHQRCVCGAPLLARYDLTAARRWPKSTLAGREASMWRYREILPLLQSPKGLDAAVSLGEGWTPLVRARRLGATLSLRRLYVKDEGLNPTGSLKARGFSAALTRAMHVGVRGVAVAAAGLAAPAAAAYSARAALSAKIFTPKDVRRSFVADSELHGAEIAQVDGTLADAERAAEAFASQSSCYDLSALHEPYRVEGQKTIGYEIAEQLGWELPDWILCPVGSGSTFIGIWKAFVEMASLGWIDPVRRPHMVAIQPAGCAPIVRAVAASAEHAEPWSADAIRTLADDLRVPDPAGAALVLRAIRESSGSAVGAGDTEMVTEMKTLAKLEGLSAAPGAGAAVHALRVLAGEGRIKPHDTVVIVNPATAGPYAS
ncbi:MAG TPA: threonine synthase [Vicinamibacterales bacterium]|nr:threonine synthase [Vicinamibacterales bacterium]